MDDFEILSHVEKLELKEDLDVEYWNLMDAIAVLGLHRAALMNSIGNDDERP